MSSSRIADIAHKSFVSVCLFVTVAGLGDMAFMHRNIMAKGQEALAAKEMEQLRQMREQGSQPFPDGTDLHGSNPPAQQQRS